MFCATPEGTLEHILVELLSFLMMAATESARLPSILQAVEGDVLPACPSAQSPAADFQTNLALRYLSSTPVSEANSCLAVLYHSLIASFALPAAQAIRTLRYDGGTLAGPLGSAPGISVGLTRVLTFFLRALPLMCSRNGECGYRPLSSSTCTASTALSKPRLTTK